MKCHKGFECCSGGGVFFLLMLRIRIQKKVRHTQTHTVNPLKMTWKLLEAIFCWGANDVVVFFCCIQKGGLLWILNFRIMAVFWNSKNDLARQPSWFFWAAMIFVQCWNPPKSPSHGDLTDLASYSMGILHNPDVKCESSKCCWAKKNPTWV